MRAEIVSIGTELLLGSITDTNASYLAQRLAALGIDCYFVSQVGDNVVRVVETLRRAIGRSDLTVVTGGLGPTGDDLTRESIAALLGETPYVVPELEEHLRAFFARRGAPMPSGNVKQATLIPSARVLPNPIGTAPGWLVQCHDAGGRQPYIVAMPGVPFEMKRMWEEEVEGWLRPLSQTLLVSRTLKILGLGESAIDEKVADLMAGSNPTVAPYAKQDGVHLRITAKATTEEQAQALIAPIEEELRGRFGDSIYGADDDTPSGVVANLLDECRVQISTLEIGAGAVGAISSQLCGYSEWLGGLTCNSTDDTAALLGDGTGEQTIEALARTLLVRSGAHVALAVKATQEPAVGSSSVRAQIETVLVPSGRFEDPTAVRTSSQWTTARDQVPRLAGLGALNMLRKWLLANGSRVRQLNEV
jgi:nicotinamide-nucleotide amidase